MKCGINPAAAQLLISRGVPPQVAHLNSFETNGVIHSIKIKQRDGTTKVWDRRKQEKMFTDCLGDSDNDWFLCMTGELHPRHAQIAAAQIMSTFMARQAACYWHRVNSSRYDKLRDDEGFRIQQGRLRLLVIDGLNINSEASKLEKVYDLLEMFGDVCRIVVASGTDPVDFAYRRIHLPANRVCYFSDTVTVQI